MKNNLKTLAFSGQVRFLEIHGDLIWDALCDNVIEDHFSIASAVARIRYLKRFTPSTRGMYLRAVLRNVAAQDWPPVKAVGHSWVWVDGATA